MQARCLFICVQMDRLASIWMDVHALTSSRISQCTIESRTGDTAVLVLAGFGASRNNLYIIQMRKPSSKKHSVLCSASSKMLSAISMAHLGCKDMDAVDVGVVGMVDSRSLSSALEKLYFWERKLYAEVKKNMLKNRICWKNRIHWKVLSMYDIKDGDIYAFVNTSAPSSIERQIPLLELFNTCWHVENQSARFYRVDISDKEAKMGLVYFATSGRVEVASLEGAIHEFSDSQFAHIACQFNCYSEHRGEQIHDLTVGAGGAESLDHAAARRREHH